MRGARRSTRWVLWCACLLALAVPATARAVAMPAFTDGGGVHVLDAQRLGDRLFALTLGTPLLTAPTHVRVLVPTDYDAHPRRRYPVLWLFHGTSGGAADWTARPGRAQDLTKDLPLIVVMPDAGVDGDGGGWFTDWVNGGAYGPPEWETWHIGHLLPWIDAHLRTIADRRGRAIAGLSQGGFGAMSYAARHPDLFLAAISFSGALDIAANPLEADPIVTPVINATEVGLDRVAPFTFFGDRLTNEINWAAHDPATLASNLRGMRLFTYTGDGRPGPLDRNPIDPAGTAIEAGAHTLTTLFVGELAKRSIPVEAHDYGPGTHTWPYWERDLADVLPPLMRDFAHPPAPPAPVDFQSDSPTYGAWGWTVALDRPVREFSRLQEAGAAGFVLAGSGVGTVTTPARYRAGATAHVTRRGPSVDDALDLRVGRDGRLTVPVPLGPANRAAQFTPGTMTRAFTTRVTIEAPRRTPGPARRRRGHPHG